jgi:BTB/POZ domain
MAKVANFNVGGKQYKVSHSLIEMHPNSLLAQSASKQMQVNPGEEIYLDRDGNIFKYVLDYLRDDGCVYLPMMYISKAAFLADLVYYRVEVDESKIVCNYGCAARALVEMDNEIKSWDAHSDIVTLAKECISIYSKSGCKLQVEIHDPRISLPIPNDDDDDDDTIPMCSLDTWMAVLSLFCTDGNGIFPHAQVECNEYLAKIGLEIINAVRVPDKGIIQVTMTLTDM